MRAMADGRIARVEELTRIPSDVQDALITILSEKTLPIPELDDGGAGASRASTSSPPPTTATAASTSSPARCAGASTPSCCRCRPTPRRRSTSSPAGSTQLGRSLELPAAAGGAGGDPPRRDDLPRAARRASPRTAGPSSSRRRGTLSTAEAISVVTNGLALAAHFGDGVLRPGDVAGRHPRRRRQGPGAGRASIWQEYLEAVVRERDGWGDFYRACREVSG